jgi:hypothetical protein
MHDFNKVLQGFYKQATAVMTPEAMQAAIQPPMDPSMGGGMPADPSMMGGMPPQDPAMMGGAPAPAPAPAMGPQGAGGGQIPPEILQDQMFMEFLQSMGIMFDPQSGTFMDPNGQPLAVDEIIQIYDMFQQELAAQQGGAPAEGGAPMDPAMAGAGMPPEAGGAPMAPGGDMAAMGGMEAAPAGAVAPAQEGMDPSLALPPDAAMDGGMPPMDDGSGNAAAMDPAAGGDPAMAAGAEQPDPIMEIASAVMSGVEATLEDFTANIEKKLSALLDKVEGLNKAVDALQQTTDRRDDDDKKKEASLQDELAAELQPTLAVPVEEPQAIEMVPKTAAAKPAPTNLFDFICQQKG